MRLGSGLEILLRYLKIKRTKNTNNLPPWPNTHIIKFIDLDPIEEYLEDRLVPIEDLKEF